jgi:HTH-type transcriptional regulator / antitoxin HigA
MLRTRNKRRIKDSYLRLVREFPIRPLRTKKDHRSAMDIYERLTREVKKGLHDPGATDYVMVLAQLISEYEERRGFFDTSHVTAADIVRFLLEEREMSVSARAREVGE